MTAAKQNDEANRNTATEQDDLATARQRTEELESENARLKSEARRARTAAGKYEDVAAKIEGESRVGHFFRHLGRGTIAAASLAAGAAIGVGGTVLVKNRMGRTAVGSSGHVDVIDANDSM